MCTINRDDCKLENTVSKADSNTWESITRSKLKLESLSRAMEAIHELKVCPVMAKEAVHELSACPVTAGRPFMNSLPVLSRPRRPFMNHLLVLSRPWRPFMNSQSATVAAMETAQELSACSVTVKWSVLVSAPT